MYMPYYFYEDDLIGAGMVLMLSWIPAMVLAIAGYVLTALALYQLARRRGLRNPWLAWIPVADSWLLGSVSDQYRYVARGEERAKRKSLLVLGIANLALCLTLVVLSCILLTQMVVGTIQGYPDEYLFNGVVGLVFGILGLLLPVVAVAIAYTIVRYMALYDVYRSMDPGNCVLFLVLSILFRVTEPFFLFFNRNKDLGMPPRRQIEAVPQPAYQEPWQQPEGKDYL